MKGVHGKILTIDCKEKKCREESVSAAVFERFLGGKGLASHLLVERNPAGVDPLSPDNKLIFATGPANGFSIWGANRYAAFTKSPLTGIYSESYSGGKAFLHIVKTGYDAIILEGALDKWSYCEVNNGSVSFEDAGFLAGKDSLETERILKDKYAGQKAGILTIGPAGENLVKFAYINNDFGRCLGRTGVGAVMGSKKIKAIVFLGDREKQAADSDLLKVFWKEQFLAGSENPVFKAYKKLGTPMMVDLTSTVEAFPSEYWQRGTVPHIEKINADALNEACEVKAGACTFCFIACNRLTTIKSGRHKGMTLDGPEYETIGAFGGLNMVDDIREIAYLNDVCDRLGMDTITAGNVTAFAIAAYKRGKIDFAVDYGDADRIADLLHMIATREGIGDLLAEGVRFAAKELGLEDMAIHVKGLEPPAFDPRYLKGMGLGFAVSDRGACHLRTTFYKPELAGLIPPEKVEGKAAMLLEYEDRLTIYDTLILCRFFRDLFFWDELKQIVKGTLGLDLGEKDFKEISRNIALTIREFNLREGMKPGEDFLPEFFFKHPIGKNKLVLEKKEFSRLVSDYYALRGYPPSDL
ncbi:MAG: aldehyde ferredoxin oxidoreductase family protein [Candidatus Aminicenantes bacterium]|nr:aldehyde ferredoxin oxidoreductase family protein [Candidatus Aminicenantes bacterium]